MCYPAVDMNKNRAVLIYMLTSLNRIRKKL
jgi:hypothetical protein